MSSTNGGRIEYRIYIYVYIKREMISSAVTARIILYLLSTCSRARVLFRSFDVSHVRAKMGCCDRTQCIIIIIIITVREHLNIVKRPKRVKAVREKK